MMIKKAISTNLKVWKIDDRSIQLLIMRGKITHFGLRFNP